MICSLMILNSRLKNIKQDGQNLYFTKSKWFGSTGKKELILENLPKEFDMSRQN